ncbi:hypothetical protein G7046_g10146 [Stylonectria norvegica]|nr:hypothetical protein G7046_g10146 [Stylonectria norvegica]
MDLKKKKEAQLDALPTRRETVVGRTEEGVALRKTARHEEWLAIGTAEDEAIAATVVLTLHASLDNVERVDD